MGRKVIRKHWSETGWILDSGRAMQYHMHLPGGLVGMVRDRDEGRPRWQFRTAAGRDMDQEDNFGWTGDFKTEREAMIACEQQIVYEITAAMLMLRDQPVAIDAVRKANEARLPSA